MFPVETVEKILSFCDGKTLFCASNVDYNWRKSVEYLTQVCSIHFYRYFYFFKFIIIKLF